MTVPAFPSLDALFDFVMNAVRQAVNNPVRTHIPQGIEDEAARGFHVPWSSAVPALVAAVNVQQLAATVEGSLRAQLEQSANASIAQVLDDYCGIPPRLIPWPFPGPPPWVFAIALELNAIANTSEAAGMRDGLLKVAGQVLQRGFGQATASGLR